MVLLGGAVGLAAVCCWMLAELPSLCLSVLQWGGGIMGMKSQHKQKVKERVLAKELAQRAGV